jgi:hypothetical protein
MREKIAEVIELEGEVPRQHARKVADAILNAMREPTDAMVEAAEDADDPGSDIYGDPGGPCSHRRAWQLMIDAALAEDHPPPPVEAVAAD